MALLTVHPTGPILQVSAVHLGICPLYMMAGAGTFPKVTSIPQAAADHALLHLRVWRVFLLRLLE